MKNGQRGNSPSRQRELESRIDKLEQGLPAAIDTAIDQKLDEHIRVTFKKELGGKHLDPIFAIKSHELRISRLEGYISARGRPPKAPKGLK